METHRPNNFERGVEYPTWSDKNLLVSMLLSRRLKPELDEAGVHIQLVCPGFVRTPLTDKNEFEMPFLMEPEKAAKAFYKGLMSKRFEIVFPWQMGVIFKLIKVLPSPLAFAITRKMIPEE